jgi:Rieske Fe-S protein
MASDWIKGHEVKGEEEIPIGSGAVFRKGLRHIAAYRDNDGEVHRMSAVCPHMKCIVTWNASERSWADPFALRSHSALTFSPSRPGGILFSEKRKSTRYISAAAREGSPSPDPG